MINTNLDSVQKRSIFRFFDYNGIDKHLLVSLAAISVFGIVILYSASNMNSSVVDGQVFRIIIGFAAFYLASCVRLNQIRYFSPISFMITVLLLLLVELIGKTYLGAQRWLSVGGISFQPSEIAKLTTPLFIAWLCIHFGDAKKPTRLLGMTVAVCIPVLLIMAQPDLGTAIMVLISGAVIIFLAGMQKKYIWGLLIAFLVSLPITWKYVLHDYQRERIEILFSPETDISGAGYHVNQSKIAIGNGGMNGTGWLNGTQSHLSFIPEQETDFIFSVLAEEFGFKGYLLLLALYMLVVGRLYLIALQLHSPFEKLVSASVATIFSLYILLNIGMVIGVFPVVGVPLPLVSYGGTSMLVLMLECGLVSSFYRRQRSIL